MASWEPVDDQIRALERALAAAQGDEAAACAYLAALARALDLPADPGEPVRLGGRPVLGPLLGREKPRVESLEPGSVVLDTTGVPWILEGPRGRALFAAVLKVRHVEAEHLARIWPPGHATWFAIDGAVDAVGAPLIERLARVIAESGRGRVASLLAMRREAAVGRRLARLVTELTAEHRPRLYDALAEGTVPLDEEARGLLRIAVGRELPAIRPQVFRAISRGATVDSLRVDAATGPPEVRACAFLELIERLPSMHGRRAPPEGLPATPSPWSGAPRSDSSRNAPVLRLAARGRVGHGPPDRRGPRGPRRGHEDDPPGEGDGEAHSPAPVDRGQRGSRDPTAPATPARERGAPGALALRPDRDPLEAGRAREPSWRAPARARPEEGDARGAGP